MSRHSTTANTASAVDELYRAHAQRLVRLAAAITLDPSRAEEVMQDAFVELQRRFERVDDPVGYLQRTVVNRSISVIRRRRVMLRSPQLRPGIALNPELDETWTSVCKLPPRERAVVVLRFWQDMSEADIAASLDWPHGTVKSTLHRALARLRKELD